MTEAQLTTKCIKKLRAADALAVKIHGGPHQPVGLPDIIGCYEGHFFGIEMKLPGKEKTLTVKQRKKLRDIYQAGGFAWVCTSVEECLRLLHNIERLNNGKSRVRRKGWFPETPTHVEVEE